MPAEQKAIEWIDDQPFDVPIVHFSHDDLDRPEDIIKEAVIKNLPLRPIITGLIRSVIAQERQEAVAHTIALVVDAENPRLAADLIAFASGICVRQGIGMPELARKHAITKQGVEQGVDKYTQMLGLPQRRGGRSKGSKANMALARKD